MSRYRIQVALWPRLTMFEGKRIDQTLLVPSVDPVHYDLEIADAELLAAEWQRAPSKFEQEAARSIRAALHEHEAELIKEDDANGHQ